jgi:hypothetical protein
MRTWRAVLSSLLVLVLASTTRDRDGDGCGLGAAAAATNLGPIHSCWEEASAL